MPRPNRVAEYRKRLGLSQVKLAKMIGVSNSTISDIENHYKIINSNERIKLAEAFNLSDTEELYRKDG